MALLVKEPVVDHMIVKQMTKVYIYVVDRDLGFAPNPFHGMCTLATCKAQIRSTAQIGDWIFGMGGRRLRAAGRCIFAMKVTEKVTYNEYWLNPKFNDKKSVRNGSKIMMLGDNIYHQNVESNIWSQAHSHHSNADGTINEYNLKKDTSTDKVLISNHFYYFGQSAPVVPPDILKELGYKNKIGHYAYNYSFAKGIVEWIEREFQGRDNLVLSDPFNFDKSQSHYSYETNRIT
jgi:hypothetical protein